MLVTPTGIDSAHFNSPRPYGQMLKHLSRTLSGCGEPYGFSHSDHTKTAPEGLF